MGYSFNDWKEGVIPPKGWDAADCVADGWTRNDLERFMHATVERWSPEIAAGQAAGGHEGDLASSGGPNTDLPPARCSGDSSGTQKPDAAIGDLDDDEEATRSDDLNLTRDSGGRPILDPRDPMPSARALLAERYTVKGLRAMHHYRGTFWRWDGSRFRDADRDSVQAIIWKYLDNARKLVGKECEVLPYQPNRTAVENVAGAFKAVCNLPGHVETPTWLVDHKNAPDPLELLPVRNGLLHLPSGRLSSPTPAFFCLHASGVSFDPEAPEPKEWLRFLQMIWPDDVQAIEALQEVFGYFLSPDTSQQKIPLIIGPKRSGKGTIARVLTALLGQDSVTAPTLASLATNFGLAPLIGRTVAIIGDARLSGKADQSAIAERLLSISGEDSLTIDRKFEAAWTGRLGVRFVIMSNELPRLSDASGALASRFLVLTMSNSFYGREDRGLGNRLMFELPGILNWARAGYLRLRDRGYFVPPESALGAVEELEALGSPISAFVKERCKVAPGLRCAVDDMFAAWQDWCSDNGRKEPGTVQSFGRDLRAAVNGLAVTRPGSGLSRVRHYEGIDLAGFGSPGAPEDW
ncbi:putative DNA primase/helicase [Roseinatronobacter thiooxidans]|uniref:Putative DNA primase/helicase n=1 Tax=Roseinatronobacter thiooxidans TaxID=121821 RepID=A0A2W7Q5E8_9RHOB|nr:phage/plasmid primase, P4 family [Roseinatronobacter thiooxidans]PZX39387.1 putative DNA primase/helicase [Roseinatronobacter thiooxidans]